MISIAKTGDSKEFELLLDNTVENVRIALRISASQSNKEFEEAVCRAMELSAKDTQFEGKITQTGDHDFPDIVIGEYYGVEVKQTKKDKFTTHGNSIFEQTRVDGVESLYLFIAKTGGESNVIWRPYASALANIIITHSPRYAVNAELESGNTVFDKMGVSYDEFRRLTDDEKMQKVRTLYDSGEHSKPLWWLSVNPGSPSVYRLYSSLDTAEKENLRAAMMFVCPEMFGRSTTKFTKAVIYALANGVVVPNVRDLFTAGGKEKIDNIEYPRIYKKAQDIADRIRLYCDNVDTKMLVNFWPENIQIPMESNERWDCWLKLADKANKILNLSDILADKKERKK